MEFKSIYCLLPHRKGLPGPCGAYLGDIEAGRQVTVRFTCRFHPQGANRIQFSQNAEGIVTYRELPKEEDKTYNSDDRVRIHDVA
jgi:hypothetical protein